MKRYAFCPVCGHPYGEVRPGATEPYGEVRPLATEPSLLECRSCGFRFWQNSKPAVAAMITRAQGGRPEVLLSRRGIDPFKGRWDLPGGFLSNGELPTDGLDRELREEIGVRSNAARLFTVGIAEYPRDDHAAEARFVLTLYYRCEIDLAAPLTAADDVAEVRWYPLGDLPSDMAFPTDVRALRELAQEIMREPRAS